MRMLHLKLLVRVVSGSLELLSLIWYIAASIVVKSWPTHWLAQLLSIRLLSGRSQEQNSGQTYAGGL